MLNFFRYDDRLIYKEINFDTKSLGNVYERLIATIAYVKLLKFQVTCW